MDSPRTEADARFFDELRPDCRHFRPERPCRPHKERGLSCGACDEYEPAARRACIVKLAADGDVLRTTSFLPGLAKLYPDARFHWLTAPSAVPLLDQNPWIDELHASAQGSLPAALTSRAYDVVLCPDADVASVSLASSVRLAEGGTRVGFGLDDAGRVQPLCEAAKRWFLLGLSDERKRANRETYQDLVGAILGLEPPVGDRPILVLDDDERAAAGRWLDSKGGDAGSLVGLVTGAGRRWPLKQWPFESQLELIGRLAERGHLVLLLGGPAEATRHRELLAASPSGSCLDAGTDNTLPAFAAKLELCASLVTGDTLALHVACALGKQVVALFGPTSAAEIELYGSGTKLQASSLDCLACYGNCDKRPNCQELISVDMVVAALEPYLS